MNRARRISKTSNLCRHPSAARFGSADPRHYRCGIFKDLGSLGKAFKGATRDIKRLVSVEHVTAGFPCCRVDYVPTRIRPFIKKFYGVVERGNLADDISAVFYENRAIKQSLVHHILQVGERLVGQLKRSLNGPWAIAQKYSFRRAVFKSFSRTSNPDFCGLSRCNPEDAE